MTFYVEHIHTHIFQLRIVKNNMILNTLNHRMAGIV
jgi:hypothetical protein